MSGARETLKIDVIVDLGDFNRKLTEMLSKLELLNSAVDRLGDSFEKWNDHMEDTNDHIDNMDDMLDRVNDNIKDTSNSMGEHRDELEKLKKDYRKLVKEMDKVRNPLAQLGKRTGTLDKIMTNLKTTMKKKLVQAFKTIDNHAVGLTKFFGDLVNQINDLITAKVQLAYRMASLAPIFAKTIGVVGGFTASVFGLASSLGA